jgi:hypothetical protein
MWVGPHSTITAVLSGPPEALRCAAQRCWNAELITAASRAQVRRFARMKREPAGGGAPGDSDDEESSGESSDSEDAGQGRALALPTPQGAWSLGSVRAAPAGPPAPRAGAGWWPWAGEPGHAQDDAQHAPWPSAVATAVTLSAAVVVFVKPPGDKGRGGGGGGCGSGRRRVGRHAPSPASLFAEAAQGGVAWPAPVPAPAPAPQPAPAPARPEAPRKAASARAPAGPRRGAAVPRLDVAAYVLAAALCVLAALEFVMARRPTGPTPVVALGAGKRGLLLGLPSLPFFDLNYWPASGAGRRAWPRGAVRAGVLAAVQSAVPYAARAACAPTAAARAVAGQRPPAGAGFGSCQVNNKIAFARRR